MLNDNSRSNLPQPVSAPPARPMPDKESKVTTSKVAIYGVMLGALAVTFLTLTLLPANAQLHVCNRTDKSISVALNEENIDASTTSGWWFVEQGKCRTILNILAATSKYAIYAQDEDGVSWRGDRTHCVDTVRFSMRTTNDCDAKKLRDASFALIRNRGYKAWTINLFDSNRVASNITPTNNPALDN